MTRSGTYFAMQVDEKRGLGWQTAWSLPGYTLEDAQEEAKNVCRKRKWGMRVVHVKWEETVIEPAKKNIQQLTSEVKSHENH